MSGPTPGETPLAALKPVLDLLATAILLVDRSGAIRLMNSEAVLLLRQRPELDIESGRIVARRADEHAALAAAIEAAFATGRQTVFAFRTREGVAECAVAMQSVAAYGLVLVIVTAVRSGDEAHSAVLATILRLTAAEIRLVDRLQSGTSLVDAADIDGISITTARSALRSIFSKSGTRNQSALLSVLCRLSKLRRRSPL